MPPAGTAVAVTAAGCLGTAREVAADGSDYLWVTYTDTDGNGYISGGDIITVQCSQQLNNPSREHSSVPNRNLDTNCC